MPEEARGRSRLVEVLFVFHQANGAKERDSDDGNGDRNGGDGGGDNDDGC